MTLCVAWNSSGKIHFASDSRIKSGCRYSDNAIKIIPVPINVYEARDSETGEMSTLFHQQYGMCFAGSFLGAYVIREFMICTLQRLQCIPKYVDLSFVEICHIIYKFYNHLVSILYKDLEWEHSIDFFISGYCPQDKILKIAKFYIKYNDSLTGFIPNCSLIDNASDFVESLGTGDDEFKRNYDHFSTINNRDLRVFNSINLTIDNQKVPSVGGNIQYGTFDSSNNFITSGIIQREYDDNGNLKKTRFCIAGIDMMSDAFDPKDDELFIMGSFIDPFKK